MTGEARNVYYVGSAMDDDLHERLTARNWTVELIDPGKRAPASRRFDQASAGILDFSHCQFPRDLPVLHALLSVSTSAGSLLVIRNKLPSRPRCD